MRSHKWIVLLVASTTLLWGATRINLSQARGTRPGLFALNANKRAFVAAVASGLTLDVGSGTLSASVTGTPPQVSVYHATSGQTVFSLPSMPPASAAQKLVLVYRNGLLQAATDDYTLAAPADGGDVVQILAYY